MLGDMSQNHVGGNGRHLVQASFAELALHVVFASEAKAAMRLQAGVSGFPTSLGGQILGHVGLDARVLARIDLLAGAPTHEVSGLQFNEALRERELNALIWPLGRPKTLRSVA